VNPTTGAVTIPANSVQDGSTVKAVAKDKANHPSTEATAQAQNDPNTPTVGTDKKTIYVFKDTEIATVTPGTDVAGGDNKVKVATLEDPEGIQSVTNKNTVDLGYTVDTEGNVSGTPKAPRGLGAYSSSLVVTDKTGATTEVFPQSPTDNRYVAHIMDVTAGEISKAVGETTTADEILAKVNVNTGTSNTKDPAINTRYR
ncbi:TPA: hypothetical protein ACGO4F_002447, partial [Streptococcus suis]